MARGLTAREKYFQRIESLALSALPITELPLVASPPTHHDGVMVALVPDDPERFAVEHDEALPADDLHVTLCFLGKVQNLSNADKARILSKTRSTCDAVGYTFSTSADGVVLMGSNDEGVPATALLIQADEIVALYDALSEALDYKSNYPSFIPHMTSGYGVPVEDVQHLLGEPMTFSKIIVKFGDDVVPVSLASAITAAPRSANVIDRVIDSLGRLWDEALHPRDGEGKFIKKNGAISGKLAVPTRDRKGVNMVDANRASVIGFHTFDNDVWVLAEITNSDGSKVQGFARATNVRAVAPVKARLDALYPIDSHGDAFINSSLERKRQLDLILAHINSEFGPSNDEAGAFAFLESLGLWEKDLDYMMPSDSDDNYLGGIRKVSTDLSDDEIDEQESIIEDAQLVKELRTRVHGLVEDQNLGFSAEDAHVIPEQRLLGDAPDPEIVDALRGGADPFSLATDNLLGAMIESDRFDLTSPQAATGVSPIKWLTDPTESTDHDVRLAGTGTSSTDRAYFVKQSVIGAQFGNSDIVNEVAASLIAENVAEAVGADDDRLLKIPRSVFGDNPDWDGNNPPGSDDPFNPSSTYQPGHVISQHAEYLIPSDWATTDAATEETALQNDIRGLDDASKVDQTEAFYEDMGDLYGNSVAKMVLWDFVILNGDRNPGNAILAAPPDGSEGTVIPIDHGFSFDEPFVEGQAQESFEWFMNYQFTKAWLNYVRNALNLNNNVTEESLRKMIQDFADTYGKIDADKVLEAFRSLPGVTDDQIARVEESLPGVVDRIQWISDNIEAVLRRMTERA